jgi:hypothetical protein
VVVVLLAAVIALAAEIQLLVELHKLRVALERLVERR